jgi:hypothetical protein
MTSRSSALGMSQEIWSPTLAENIRPSPVCPQPLPPPTDPASSPVRRPKPLYPNVSARNEFV